MRAQSGSSSSTGFDIDKIISGSQSKSALDAQKLDQTAYDNVVKPEYYTIGPGDVLTYLKLDAASVDETLVVSPENMIFLPRLGAINVSNMTLAAVRDTILALQKARTPLVQAFLGLKKPRMVYVTVRGNVISPGLFTVPASMRVQTVLKLAMQVRSQLTDPSVIRSAAQALGQTEMLNDIGALRQRKSLFPASIMRNIVVRHSDKTSQICDLHKAEYTGLPTDDPYVREGDEIYVPAETRDYAPLSINGGVATPTMTVYKSGDSISMLLKLGGYCTNLARAPKAVLIRNNEKIELNIDENLGLRSGNMPAQAGDVIIVDEDIVAPFTKTGSVTVKGEIEKPGTYPIVNNVTRLKDVMDLVGGLREEAYLPLAQILRREKTESGYLSSDVMERMKRMQNSNLLLEDTTRFAIDEMGRKPLVSANFERGLTNSSSEDNVLLQDGDVIVVPRNPHTVYVYGQVRNGGYFTHVPGRTMEQYISMAGGMTPEADKGRERVIKGKTGVWLKGTEATVDAGDKIYVPHPPDEPLGQQIQRSASYVTIAASIVNIFISAIYVYIALKR